MAPDIVRNIRKIQILTPHGFCDFNGISRKKVQEFYRITFPNGEVLECTDDHRVKTKDGFVEAYRLPYKKEIVKKEVYVYDPINVGSSHEYLTGSIINHNCVEFLGSSGTLISGWKLKELVHQMPINQREGLVVYKNVEENHVYVIVADVSEGKGLDYSAFHVIDVSKMPYEQVCVYRNNMVTPLDYADVLQRVAKNYNRAAVLVEVNNMGAQVSGSLHYDFEYDNILFTENAGRAGKRISSGFGPNVDMGVRTTLPVKTNGCSMLKLLIEQNQFIVNDFHTIEELSRFSKKGKSYEAEEGAHDDLVMGLVLFAWLSDQQYFKDYTNINTLMKLREKSEEEVMSDLLPFGFVDGGMDEDGAINELGSSASGSWLFNETF